MYVQHNGQMKNSAQGAKRQRSAIWFSWSCVRQISFILGLQTPCLCACRQKSRPVFFACMQRKLFVLLHTQIMSLPGSWSTADMELRKQIKASKVPSKDSSKVLRPFKVPLKFKILFQLTQKLRSQQDLQVRLAQTFVIPNRNRNVQVNNWKVSAFSFFSSRNSAHCLFSLLKNHLAFAFH